MSTTQLPTGIFLSETADGFRIKDQVYEKESKPFG